MNQIPTIGGVLQSKEITALIGELHGIGQRLEDLTVGEVDTVADHQGRTFVLRHAQENFYKMTADRQSAVLDALSPHIALLDHSGVIISVNEAWRRFGRENAFENGNDGVGLNYLNVCDVANNIYCGEGGAVAAGLRGVLRGERATFSIEYSCHSLTEQRWFRFTATPLSQDRLGGAVVMHVNITERMHAEAALQRFCSAMDATADAIYLVDRDSMRFVHVNDAACAMQGCSRESLLATAPADLLQMAPTVLEKLYDKLIASNTAAPPVEMLRLRQGGSTAWVELRRHAMLSNDRWTIVTLVRDVTERKQAESRINRLDRVEAMSSGINKLIVRVHDRDSLFEGACRIAVEAGAFGCAWIGTVDSGNGNATVVAAHSASAAQLVELDLVAGTQIAPQNPQGFSALGPGYPLQAVTCNDIAADPTPDVRRDRLIANGYRSTGYFPLMLADQPVAVLALFGTELHIFDAAETRLLVELTSNISFALDHIEQAAKLRYLAYYDHLTGLANQNLFLERVATYIRTATDKGHRLGVFLIDLERFKNINDSLGQAVGDALLLQVAQWLSEHVGSAITLARIGADHFGVVMPELRSDEETDRLISGKIDAFLNHPFRVNDAVFRVAFKMGVALFPQDGSTADTLFKNAEAALKKAKVRGDRYLYFTKTMTDAVASKVTLENQLRQALERDEFVLHYQPKISLATGKLVSAEALIRWNDPRTGLVPPARFIPILEETGLIHEVGRWAVQQALRDHLHLRSVGLAGVRIAVNVSPLQLRSRNFISEIEAALSIDANAAVGLELEITESLIMEDVAHSITTLHAVRSLGVKIAIDDFGTGFSSLSYLSKLPVDTIKIDRSFIIDMTTSPEGLLLVSTIINLAHSLKMKVVAEGVETEEQSRLLRLLNCDVTQGFLYSKPIPRELFKARYLKPLDAQ